MEGKLTKRPYKPYITSLRCRGGRSGFRPRGGCSSSDRHEGWPRSRGRGFSHKGRVQGRKFDKSPATKRPRVSGGAEDKRLKINATIATSEDTLQLNAPRKIKSQSQKSSEGKKFEDYTYAYGGAEEPQLATALPQAYEEALTAMRQSEKSRSPAWFKHVKGNLCSTKTLPKDGVRPQLIPECEVECLTSPQV